MDMDITISELLAQFMAGDSAGTWWATVTTATPVPNDLTVNELLYKTLEAAHKASSAKNSTLAAGNRIDGYPVPVHGTAVRRSNGDVLLPTTASLRTLLSVNSNTAVSPLV